MLPFACFSSTSAAAVILGVKIVIPRYLFNNIYLLVYVAVTGRKRK